MNIVSEVNSLEKRRLDLEGQVKAELFQGERKLSISLHREALGVERREILT